MLPTNQENDTVQNKFCDINMVLEESCLTVVEDALLAEAIEESLKFENLSIGNDTHVEIEKSIKQILTSESKNLSSKQLDQNTLPDQLHNQDEQYTKEYIRAARIAALQRKS